MIPDENTNQTPPINRRMEHVEMTKPGNGPKERKNPRRYRPSGQKRKKRKCLSLRLKRKKKLRFAVNPFHADHQRNMYRCDFYIVPVAATALLASLALSERLMSSCARQRLVAASSRRTEENVASRSGSGRHCRRASRARLLSLSLVPLVN